MKLIACSLLKKKQGIFNPPFFVRTKQDALDLVNNYFADEKHKADKNLYELYCVGTFDDETGILTGFKPEKILEDV